MKKILLLLLIYCWQNNLSAQFKTANPLRTSLDSAVDRAANNYLASGKRAGLSIGFVISGKTYTYHYGETLPGSGIVPGKGSVYEIGSITKTFTGLLIAHAVQEGKVKLDEDIRTYLPGNYPDLHYPNGDAIKLNYLLAHTSMFPFDFPLNATNENLASQLQKLRFSENRLEKFQYSNAAYQVLGYILQSVYKQSYSELLKRYITRPLKMRNTGVITKGVLKGYSADFTEAGRANTDAPAAGGITSNIGDMLNYMAYQLEANAPLVKQTHSILLKSPDQSYGYQWAIGATRAGDRYIRTDGGTNGFRSFLSLYPDLNTGVILLTNQNDPSAGGELYKLTLAILAEVKKRE